jgi:hypothetical protein
MFKLAVLILSLSQMTSQLYQKDIKENMDSSYPLKAMMIDYDNQPHLAVIEPEGINLYFLDSQKSELIHLSKTQNSKISAVRDFIYTGNHIIAMTGDTCMLCKYSLPKLTLNSRTLITDSSSTCMASGSTIFIAASNLTVYSLLT